MGEAASGAFDLQKAARVLRDAAKLLRGKFTAVDWPTVRNPGITWGRGIAMQGDPWEKALEAAGGLGVRTAATFKTFDSWDYATKTAISAKTLDTTAFTYRNHPGAIYARLRGCLDRIATFEKDRVNNLEFTSEMILHRRLKLAIPAGTTDLQIVQILRAKDYADSLGIEMDITIIGGTP